MEFQVKLNAKYMPRVLHCISNFEGISYKKVHDRTILFVSCCFTLAFIYISRYDFLQVLRTSFTIIEINIFVANSPFLMDSPKHLQRLKQPKSTKSDKSFLLMLPHLRLPNIAAKTTLPL